MRLALEVFMEFEAPDYSPDGVESFKRDIVENPEYLEKAREGLCPIFTSQSEEQEINGIRFTPMRYMIKCNTKSD